MSKKTLKTIRGRRKKDGKPAAPYAPSTFEPPETRKANIRTITNYLIAQISGLGMSVIVTRSGLSKSQSQYLSVDAGRRRYVIRISDHALRRGKKHDFCIYTHTPYEKALYYLSFMEKFRKMTGVVEG